MPPTRNKNSRYFMALLLTVIYLTILVSPIVQFILLPEALAHAITVGYSGDGNTCGCSAQKRAQHTCCCYSAKLTSKASDKDSSGCCDGKPAENKAMLGCSCHCGAGEQAALPTFARGEVLLFAFEAGVTPPSQLADYPGETRGMMTRSIDPPDPPPHPSFAC
jgi:hypothetical protein